MKISAGEWCEEAAKALGELISPDVFSVYMKWLRQGICRLWKIEGENYLTWIITRVELYPSGVKELVVEVIAGKNAREIMREFLRRAKALGIDRARFETHHSEKIAQRLIGDLGFKRRASVYEVNL